MRRSTDLPLLTVIAIVAIVALVVIKLDRASSAQLSSDQQSILIPDGFEFSAASAHGRFNHSETWYCTQINTGLVFECTDGQIGKQVSIPPNTTLVAVAASGQFSDFRVYFVQDEAGNISRHW